MRDRFETLIERLASLEEELRDLAYEELVEAAGRPDRDESATAALTEKRLNAARRAIAKAINELRKLDAEADGFDDLA